MRCIRAFASLALIVLVAACTTTPKEPEAPKAAGVAGAWLLTVESPMGTRENEAVFVQNGEQLTGVIKGQRGEAPLTGRPVTEYAPDSAAAHAFRDLAREVIELG